MSVHALHRAAGATAIAALALGLAACSDDADTGEQDSGDNAAANLTPQEALLASVEGLSDDSYTLETNMTLNGMDFISFTEIRDGDTLRTSSDLFWSVLPEATGLTEEEAAVMGDDFFTDSHTETITVDNTVYLQFSGSDSATIAEEFGEDAWFTRDLTDESDLADVSGETGSQPEEVIAVLSDVKETGDGVYTAVLPADSAVLQELVGASGAGGGEESALADAAVTVELDENGLFKRMSMELPESDGRAITHVSEVTETGADYAIAAPESTNLHTYEEYEAVILAA